MPDAFDLVTRPTRTATWNLVRHGATVASAYGFCRPDRRWFVSVDGWDDADQAPLVNAMIADLPHDLHTRIDGQDRDALEAWSRFGFEPYRREIEFVLSSEPARTGLEGALVPPGLALLSAEDVDETGLRELDDRLRGDVGGTQGWLNDPVEFHEQTFDHELFDPASYLVALDAGRRQFAGLVRVWSGQYRARLGLVATAPGYRRRGLARAMLAAALRRVSERGLADVTAEVDDGNVASLALLRSIGAIETGTAVVLRRPGCEPGSTHESVGRGVC